jgi:hypothetical protein
VPSPPRNRKPLYSKLVLILGLLLLLSLGWGLFRKSWSQQRKQTQAVLSEAEAKLAEGKSLVDLNPIRVRELLEKASQLVTGLPDELDQKASLQEDVQAALKLVLREYELENLTPLFDLGILKEGALGQEMVGGEETLLVLDSAEKTLYQVETEKKKGEIFAGGEGFDGASQLAACEDKIFVLTNEGIEQLTASRPELVVAKEEAWGKVLDLACYSGNLYLLNQAPDLIRYPVIETGFGSAQSWLKGEKGALSGAVSMAIDGSIWLLKESGELVKFNLGLEAPFGVAGLSEGLSGVKQVFTTPELENLYLLDQDGHRVVVLAKSGEYQAQYHWSSPTATGLVASESREKIWLLAGGKIYEIEI